MDRFWRDVRREIGLGLGLAYAAQVFLWLLLARHVLDRSVTVYFNLIGEFMFEFVLTIFVMAYLAFAIVAEALD